MVILLGEINDLLVAKENALKGKMPQVCFLDDVNGYFHKALCVYQYHPECLNEELKRSV